MSGHYLCITDGFELDDYIVVSAEPNNDESAIVNHGEHLIFFANMDASLKSRIESCFLINNDSMSAKRYLQIVKQKLEESCGISVSNVITLDLQNQLSDKSENSEEELTLKDAQQILSKNLEAACLYSRGFCMVLSNVTDMNMDIDRKAMIVANVLNGIPAKISYIPLVAISKKTGKLTCCNGYAVSKTWDAIQLFFILAIKEDTVISQCKICGKYFIPMSKRDEIYCLQCRDISYDSKIKENETLKTYRTIYKTQNARKQRNARNIRNIDERFERWKAFAKEKLNACQNGIITLEEMKQAISSDNWIKA